MKKLVLSAVLVSVCLGNAWAGDPLKVEWGKEYISMFGNPLPIIKIVAKDDITINEILINRGNCEADILGKQERKNIGYDKIKAEEDKLEAEVDRLKALFSTKKTMKEKQKLAYAYDAALDKKIKYRQDNTKILYHQLILPKTMKFAEKVQIRYSCGDILELKITTDKGEFKYGAE